ncbi:NAD(P)H-dependent oxidoreductase [Streptomyces sp. NBC_01451]|nr:hypothetical protein [Streptomyces sp. NBC_01451]
MPSVFQAWLDQVIVDRRTINYGPRRGEPLLQDGCLARTGISWVSEGVRGPGRRGVRGRSGRR